MNRLLKGRKPIAVICICAGLCALLSVPIMIPPWAGYWRSQMFVDVPDTRLSYVFWAIGIGTFLLLLGFLAAKTKSSALDNVARVARESNSDPRLIEAWSVVKDDLGAVYALARRERVPFVLIVFPYTFQFLDDEAKQPQRILARHATENGIDGIDFTGKFEDLIFTDDDIEDLRRGRRSARQIRDARREEISRYFFDADHFTPLGHQVVALALFDYLSSKDLLSPSARLCAK